MAKKRCSQCEKQKTISCFTKRTDRHNQYRSKCKDCERIRLAKYMNQYRESNPESIKAIKKKYRKKHKNKLKKYGRKYYDENKKTICKSVRLKKKKASRNLDDSYIKHALRKFGKSSIEVLSNPLLIEAKRAQLKLHRLLTK